MALLTVQLETDTGQLYALEGGGGAGAPFWVPAGETFTVPEFQQVLWTIPIELEDETSNIDVEGILVEV